jgi:hypothetical protein
MALACFNSASFVTSSGLGISVSPTIEVRRESDSALAAIYSDEAGTTPITNPSAFADTVGRFKFYAAGLARGYSILVTKGAESFTLRNVGIGTAGQLDATAFLGQGVLAAGTDGQIPAAKAAQAGGLIWTDYTRPNLLMNGNWLIDQKFESAQEFITGGAGVNQVMDGWSGFGVAAPGVFTMQQVTDPENAALKALKIACTTADATIAATDAYYIVTAVEGYDCADLMIGTASAASVTLKFKAKFNVTGVYGISVANSATNRSYVGIITVPDTAENEYTLTLALDTSGTWLYTNGVGLYLRICLAAGTDFQTTAGAWAANNMLTTSAQANFMSVNTNVGYIKRIQLIPGSVALAYGPQDVRRELAKCQRYYWKSFTQGTAPAQNAGRANAVEFVQVVGASAGQAHNVAFALPMRATPTVTFYNPSAANAQIRNASASTDWSATALDATPTGSTRVGVTGTTPAGSAAGQTSSVHITANARLA